jgi:hypothetical protein
MMFQHLREWECLRPARNEFRNAKHREDGNMPQIPTDTFWQSIVYNIAMENCHVDRQIIIKSNITMEICHVE